jgi:hypothetical protein
MGRVGPVRPSLDRMCSAGDFPVRTSASPARVLVLHARAAGCGPSSLDSLASYDPAMQSWRTSQHSVLGGLEPFSETWPRSGMTRSGTAYQLPTWAPLTDETESGLWRTAQNAKHGALSPSEADRVERGIAGLHAMVHMWPTPNSQAHLGVSLTDAVRQDGGKGRLWRTPTSAGQDAGGKDPNRSLYTQVRWMTPNSRDWKDTGPSQGNRKSPNLGTQAGGSLSPTWVEWLMGFPLGWTALEPSEMPSSRKSSKSSGERS